MSRAISDLNNLLTNRLKKVWDRQDSERISPTTARTLSWQDAQRDHAFKRDLEGSWSDRARLLERQHTDQNKLLSREMNLKEAQAMQSRYQETIDPETGMKTSVQVPGLTRGQLGLPNPQIFAGSVGEDKAIEEMMKSEFAQRGQLSSQDALVADEQDDGGQDGVSTDTGSVAPPDPGRSRVLPDTGGMPSRVAFGPGVGVEGYEPGLLGRVGRAVGNSLFPQPAAEPNTKVTGKIPQQPTSPKSDLTPERESEIIQGLLQKERTNPKSLTQLEKDALEYYRRGLQQQGR